jgi:hypothetical protein
LGAYNEINLTKWFFQYNWQIVGKRLQYRDFQAENVSGGRTIAGAETGKSLQEAVL